MECARIRTIGTQFPTHPIFIQCVSLDSSGRYLSRSGSEGIVNPALRSAGTKIRLMASHGQRDDLRREITEKVTEIAEKVRKEVRE